MKNKNLLAVGHHVLLANFLQNSLKNAVLEFLKAAKIEFSSDFGKDTAKKFVEWRSNVCFARHKFTKISASTIRHELGDLKRLAEAAGRGDLLPHWKKVIVRDEDRVNRDSKPLSIEKQKEILKSFEERPDVHDAILMLLVSGIRVSELKNARYKLNGKVWSHTLDKILERKHIYSLSENALRTVLKRRFPGVSPNRLRNTFAANNIAINTPIEDVGKMLEHRYKHTMKDIYSEYIPKKIIGDATKSIEMEKWVDFIKNRYFGEPNIAIRAIASVRNRENFIISNVINRFRKIIFYKGRTLGKDIFHDFESEAMNRLYRSVRLHINDWESGKNNKLLTCIVIGALNWVLARKNNREKLINNIKYNIGFNNIIESI